MNKNWLIHSTKIYGSFSGDFYQVNLGINKYLPGCNDNALSI